MVFMQSTQTRTLIVYTRLTCDTEIKEDRIALLHEAAKEKHRTEGNIK